MFNRITLAVTLTLLIAGCTPLDFIKAMVPAVSQKPMVSLDVGDKQIKGMGADQKVTTNNGQMVGGDFINIPKGNIVPVTITQVSWFTLFETVMLIILSITTTIGWLKPIMQWLSKLDKKV